MDKNPSSDTESKPITPPDVTRCQAEITPGHGFMMLGPRPKPERCKQPPAVIAVENKPDRQGRRGMMSLCASCVEVFMKQMPEGYASFEIVQVTNDYVRLPPGVRNRIASSTVEAVGDTLILVRFRLINGDPIDIELDTRTASTLANRIAHETALQRGRVEEDVKPADA